MEIRCPGCSRKYIIPDDRLADRLAYFACDSCGERVVVRPRAARATGTRPLKDALMSAGDILEGLRLSFNLRNCLVSMIALLAIGLLVAGSMVVASFFPAILSEMPVLGLSIAAIIGLLCIFIFDVSLYLISKNNDHRMEMGVDLRYGEAIDGILNDLKTVSLLSVGLPAACILIVLPPLLIGNGRLLYVGVAYPALILLFVALVLVQMLKNLVMAYIAAHPGTVGGTCAGILKFFARENINIPLYLILIRILSGVFAVLLLFIPVAGILFIGGFASAAGAGSALTKSGLLSGNLPSLVPGLTGTLPLDAQAGMLLIFLFSGVLFLFFGGYIVSLWQTLSSVAFAIMESNPGRSINRTAVLVWVILAAVAAWVMVAAALAITGAVKLLT